MEKLSRDLLQNTRLMETLFEKDDTFILRFVQNSADPGLTFGLCYCGGMVDNALIGQGVIRPLVLSLPKPKKQDLLSYIINQALYIHNAKPCDDVAELVEAICYGDTVVFLPDTDRAVVLGTQDFPLRSVAEPDAEKVLSGPKEGFFESLIANLSFMHRRLRTADLKMEYRVIGRRSRTRACICYLESLTDPTVLAELNSRLEQVDTDAVLDTNTLTEMIGERQQSPFRSVDTTERPDVVAAKLLEGRVALFLDGSPVVLTLPYLFIENFQTNEDYYLGSFHATFARMLRISGFFLSILVPALFIAIAAYNHEILPTPLLISVTRERQNVPLPLGLELIMMMIIFDLLREAGARMPSSIGQAMSIVGALVLGQAAVQAKIASSLVIIVVAFTGITSLLTPKMNATLIAARSLLLFLALLLGFPGVFLGLSLLIAHMVSLRSFGVAQVSLPASPRFQTLKDTVLRAPMPYMLERPFLAGRNPVRMKKTVGRWRS